MTPQFKIEKRDGYWAVDVFWITQPNQLGFTDEWAGFEEPFNEETYQEITKWCYDTFKTWLYPKRVRRMSFTQYYFTSKRDLDWFILYWSGVDIPDV